MKRIILVLIAFTSVVNAALWGQRLNKFGQKMVREIEYAKYRNNSKYDIINVKFKYNEKNELQEYELDGICNGKTYAKSRAVKKGNRIYLSGYGEWHTKMDDFEVYCNDQNLITKVVENYIYSNGDRSVIAETYKYGDVNNDGRIMLYSYNYLSKETRNKEEHYLDAMNDYTIRYFPEYDGYGISNMETNVDISPRSVPRTFRYYKATEWMPRKDYYIFNKYSHYKVEYDDRGNVTVIYDYGSEGTSLVNSVTIKYVED